MRLSAAQKMLFEKGLSPRHKGFHYLSAALCAAARGESVDKACRSVDAGQTHHADRCMRYAIRYAWDGSEGDIHETFRKYTIPPTPVELIHAILWRLDETESGQK